MLIFLLPLLSIFIYYLRFKTNPINIILTIVKYQSLFGFFGVGRVILLVSNLLNISLSIFLQRFLFLIFFSVFIALSIAVKEKKIENEIMLVILIFYITTTHFAIQYLAWIIPFLILIKPKLWQFLIFIITIFLVINYSAWVLPFNLQIFSIIIGILLWASFIFFMWILRKKC